MEEGDGSKGTEDILELFFLFKGNNFTILIYE
jgi:hypothetical protein